MLERSVVKVIIYHHKTFCDSLRFLFPMNRSDGKYKSHSNLSVWYHSDLARSTSQFSSVSFNFTEKMEVLKKVSEAKPYNGFKELPEGFHKIVCFRSVPNKYPTKEEDGKKSETILVELVDEVIFLPRHLCNRISSSDMGALNALIEENEALYLHFGGKHPDNK